MRKASRGWHRRTIRAPLAAMRMVFLAPLGMPPRSRMVRPSASPRVIPKLRPSVPPTAVSSVSDGPAVGIPASYPEVTAVGGTEFNEAGGHYWNSSNTANGASAISYISEMVWNETGAGGLL